MVIEKLTLRRSTQPNSSRRGSDATQDAKMVANFWVTKISKSSQRVRGEIKLATFRIFTLTVYINSAMASINDDGSSQSQSMDWSQKNCRAVCVRSLRLHMPLVRR